MILLVLNIVREADEVRTVDKRRRLCRELLSHRPIEAVTVAAAGRCHTRTFKSSFDVASFVARRDFMR
jgi:hypothetical protein